MASKKTRKGTLRSVGTADILRHAIVVESHEAKNADEAIKAIRNDRIGLWARPEYGQIWSQIKASKQAPTIASLRKHFAKEDTVIDQLERLVSRPRGRMVDLKIALDTAWTQAKSLELSRIAKTEAEIQHRGKDVDGHHLRGVDQAAKWATAERERVFGVADAGREADKATDQPDWAEFKIDGKTGRKTPIPDRTENTRAMLLHHGIVVRRNVMTNKREITVPDLPSGSSETANNRALARVRDLAVGYGLRPSMHGMECHLLEIEEHYHPVAEWILSRPWDGVPRLSPLIETLGYDGPKDRVTGSHITIVIRRWLISACKAALLPMHPEGNLGVAAQGMLVLAGRQRAGKTRWGRALAGPVAGAYGEAIRLDPTSRDSVAAATGSWLVELGEIDATFRKADISALKGHITSPTDQYRAPYARCDETYPRRTVYIGTVNEREYLRDVTGNRRYWTIPVSECDPIGLANLDVQQVWAEVATWVEAGEPHWLPEVTEEWLDRWNTDYEEQPPEVDAFRSIYERHPMPDECQDLVSSNDIREALIEQGKIRNVSRREMQSVIGYMRRMWRLEPVRRSTGYHWPLKRRKPVPSGLNGEVIDIGRSIDEDLDS